MKQLDGFIPTHKEFQKRVEKNFELYEDKKFKFWKYRFFDIKGKGRVKNPHTDVLSKSINDMRGAIPLGQLAVYTLHGADAFMLKDGKYIDTELKTIEIDEKKLIVGLNDKIYHEDSSLKRSTIENYFSIGFVVTNEALRQSKNRDTFVVLRTKEKGEIIDAFHLTGDIIYRELSKGDPEVATKSVSLKTFLDEGNKEPVLIPHIGWENWKQKILDNNIYLIRPMTQEDVKKKFAKARKRVREEIAGFKETLKGLSSKLSKARRLNNSTLTQMRKEGEKVEKIKEKIEELNAKKKEINNVIDSKILRSDRLEDFLNSLQSQINNLENKVEENYKEVEKLYDKEEKEMEANFFLTKLIQNPKPVNA